ncbi:hypothetical protein CJD36_021555 [Flavipsychrobacter stenotrophus]|uniref:Uncharacterized protein n=1 Tax=Flavipsychrobacter stenotrophus TaxID=2077091 RepID=A0A2S7SQG1_9BACT|nr:tetratricopeptide repeat protein [Flavipsychrobacter stenotrophus]PQJ08994.1 hypothetical protein CJD36_021555 [Flavipsychrobacter stenotrophus]
MYKCVSLSALFVFLSIVAYGEKKHSDLTVDSLKSLVVVHSTDTNGVKLLKKISEVYNQTCTDSALAYGSRSLALAKHIHWDKGVANAYMGIGVTYELRSDYPRSLENYMQALKINELIGNKRGVAAGNWGIGNIYRSQRQYDKAIMYSRSALVYYEGVQDKASISSLLLNLGNTYNLLEELDSAINIYSRVLTIKEELEDIEGESRVLMNIGSVYLKQNNYNQCIAYYFKSLRMIESTREQYDYGSILGNIGQCYLVIAKDSNVIKPDSLISTDKKTNLITAVKFLDSALAISRSLGEVNDARITSLDLSEALELLGNYKGALSMYKQHVAYKDSIFSEENIDKIAAIEKQRAREIKDKDIQIAKLRTEVYAICIAILVVVMIYIGYRLARQIKSNKQLANDRAGHLKRIASQSKILEHIAHIQSHDLRGNVATILGLSKLFNFDDASDPFNKEIIHNIDMVATKMDGVITDVINEENKLMKENL